MGRSGRQNRRNSIDVSRALQSIRRTPEDWKRRLRPALVRAVNGVRALPGGTALSPALRRVAPGLHSFLARRYRYYADAGLGELPRRPPTPEAIAALGPQARRVAMWLQPAAGHEGR
jgi:hypothetical protein